MSGVAVSDRRDHAAFIPAALDDLLLDVYEFRAYGRLVRRAGTERGAYESVPKMARACRMSERRMHTALRTLEARGLVMRQERSGEPSVYHLMPTSNWRSEPLHDVQTTPAHDAGPPLHDVQTTPARGADKGSKGRFQDEGSKEGKDTSARADARERSALAKKVGAASHREAVEAVVNAYNEHRGPLPGVRVVSAKRAAKVRGFLREFPSTDEAVACMAMAAANVAANEFWQSRRYGFDNLLADHRAIAKAEAVVESNGAVSERDAKRSRLSARLKEKYDAGR